MTVVEWAMVGGGLGVVLLYLLTVIYMVKDGLDGFVWAEDATIVGKVRVTAKYVWHETKWGNVVSAVPRAFLVGVLSGTLLKIFIAGVTTVTWI